MFTRVTTILWFAVYGVGTFITIPAKEIVLGVLAICVAVAMLLNQ